MAGNFQMTVQVRGLKELEKKLNGSVLYEDEVEDGLDTIEKRMLRGGKARSQGKKTNTVRSERTHLSRRVASTRRGNTIRETVPSFGRGVNRRKNPDFNPRVTGRAWLDYQVHAVFKKMAPNVVRKIIKRINARWSA